MPCILLWMAVNLICLVLGCAGNPAAPSEPMVTIRGGSLEGIHFGSSPRGAAFLGIPYAAPPLAELRWKPPQPAPKWSEIRKAGNFGSPCPQPPGSWLHYIEGHEDCLYLNVWTAELRPDANRPVLVYFHGGSNTQGYSQMTPLGPAFSQMGLVVVSANYRLGPFGFLAHPALTAESEHRSSGNYGLLDQLQALRWVKENIREFGGDPGRVTVMGQSAGAVDVCLLMASPLSHGLFQGAILESGECQGTLNEDIRAPIRYNFIDTTGEASGERLARDLGVPDSPEILLRLRQIPANEILKTWKHDPGLHFDAIVDGWVVPQQPAQIFAEGKQLHIPTVVGSNADEASVFGHNGLKTIGDYKSHLQQDTGPYWRQEFRLYPVSSAAEVAERSVRLESDEFASGAHSFARAMRKAGEKSYLYYFTYVDPGKRLLLGAHHGEELFFLSDSFPADWERTNEDEKLTDLLHCYWANFAKTGDPNYDGAPPWPPFENNSVERFEIGSHIGLQPVSERIRRLEAIMRHIATMAASQPTGAMANK